MIYIDFTKTAMAFSVVPRESLTQTVLLAVTSQGEDGGSGAMFLSIRSYSLRSKKCA